jgi:hypothetical protein
MKTETQGISADGPTVNGKWDGLFEGAQAELVAFFKESTMSPQALQRARIALSVVAAYSRHKKRRRRDNQAEDRGVRGSGTGS